MTTTTPAPIGATALGYPRIGRQRQLKADLERYWAGDIGIDVLDRTATAIRLNALVTMGNAGLDSLPVNTFSWYDQMLDTAMMVGAIPQRFAAVSGDDQLGQFDAARYFAMARGTQDVAPLEMTKWFDTNYHYLVPEISTTAPFSLDASKVLTEYAEAHERGRRARPVIIGPWTFLTLAKATDDSPSDFTPLDRLDDLIEVYLDLLQELSQAGVEWVQIDEPALVRDLTDGELERLEAYLERISSTAERPAILLATYFATPVEALPIIAASGVEGIALDLVSGRCEPQDLPTGADKEILLGLIDGRNVWRADLSAALSTARRWATDHARISISTSCSLLHVPYSLRLETEMDPALIEQLAFADEKLSEVVSVQHALNDGDEAAADAMAASASARQRRGTIPGALDEPTRERAQAATESDRSRGPRAARRSPQSERLQLPVLPTTTIGSFPQTAEVRRARSALRQGRITEDEYTEAMRQQIREVIVLQEDLGLDVLVHGEPERNDMVQYFAEQLEGFAATAHGWVQSYGSRCVRPPILFGDVRRPHPMTTNWARFAQGLTDKPLKGMLTGPVTMLAWSFVRDDQPLSVSADHVALALRDEVTDLEAAGIAIIQVDEPALRELLPLRRADQAAYLAWSVDSFRLATAGVRTETQIHTHLCYSEFGEIIDAIDGLDADVTSIEAARSGMELLADVAARGFDGALGPGVYDIHSPRVPDTDEISALLVAALDSLPAEQLWVNPDCGLKTRRYAEVEPSLQAMVEAAKSARHALSGSPS